MFGAPPPVPLCSMALIFSGSIIYRNTGLLGAKVGGIKKGGKQKKSTGLMDGF